MNSTRSFAFNGRVEAFGVYMRPITLSLLVAGIFTAANVFITWSDPIPVWGHIVAFLLFTALMLGSTKVGAKEVSPSHYQLPYSKGLLTFSAIMALVFVVGIFIYTNQ